MKTKTPYEYVKHLTDVLSQDGLNTKKLTRIYKKKLQSYSSGCRMKKTDLYKKYDELCGKMIGVFKATAAAPDGITNGNVAIILYLLDDHLNYLFVMKKRLANVQTLDLIQVGHEAIILKKEQLLEVLLGNLKRPITLDEFKDMMDEGDNNECESGDIEETRGDSQCNGDEGNNGGVEK